jgi:hypothetical protein
MNDKMKNTRVFIQQREKRGQHNGYIHLSYSETSTIQLTHYLIREYERTKKRKKEKLHIIIGRKGC